MPNKTKIYSVGQINSLIRTAIEEKLPSRLIVRGEISDWKHHTSGHCYFSLKDEGAVLPCVMWASKFKNVKFSPEDGMEVLSTGYIDVYPPGGKYQLYVDKLEPAGVGALQLAFEQMVAKLRKEGLFDEAHKNRRNRKLKLDVLIVGRGGGSMEDLWAFNEEVLARAIFDSTIPIISAVGHEVDTTIADLVAEARASTPTKAGVVAVPDVQEIRNRLTAVEQN